MKEHITCVNHTEVQNGTVFGLQCAIPTMAGDGIIAVPQAADDVDVKKGGQSRGDILKYLLLLLSRDKRSVEIEVHVRA